MFTQLNRVISNQGDLCGFVETLAVPMNAETYKDHSLQFPKTENCDEKAVASFFNHACNGNALLVSTCGLNPSGCHDFSSSLVAKFGADFIKVKSHSFFGFVSHDFIDTPSTPKNWEHIVVTGCGASATLDIINELKNKYYLTNLKNVYILFTPWKSHKNFLKAYIKIKSSFDNEPYRVTLLTSGMSFDSLNCIGLPNPVSTTESKYSIPDTCFGLMYVRHAFQEHNVDNYLRAYFSQVKLAAKNCERVTVLAINILNQLRVDKIAAEFQITVNHIKRLEQGDFIRVIKILAAKNGVTSFDGAQAPMQALKVGARVLIYYYHQNEKLFENLVAALPIQMQSIANVIIGQSDQYDLLANTAIVAEVYRQLFSLTQMGVALFEKRLHDIRACTSAETKGNVSTSNSTAAVVREKLRSQRLLFISNASTADSEIRAQTPPPPDHDVMRTVPKPPKKVKKHIPFSQNIGSDLENTCSSSNRKSM